MLCERQKVFFWGAYTRGKGDLYSGGLIFEWKNALLIWAPYIRKSLYTGGGGAYLLNFTVYFAENTKVHENCKIKNLLRD